VNPGFFQHRAHTGLGIQQNHVPASKSDSIDATDQDTDADRRYEVHFGQIRDKELSVSRRNGVELQANLFRSRKIQMSFEGELLYLTIKWRNFEIHVKCCC